MKELPSRADARALAASLLAPLGDRWRHTVGVAARADQLSAAVPPEERGLLVAAAWWHDLGYASNLVVTGLHSLDGARFLAAEGYPDRLCALVAHHSAAGFEAEERGLAREFAEWRREEGPVADALWTADMATGPRGEAVDYPDRFAEIMSRYHPESVVGRAMRRARPVIEETIRRTERRIAVARFPVSGMG